MIYRSHRMGYLSVQSKYFNSLSEYFLNSPFPYRIFLFFFFFCLFSPSIPLPPPPSLSLPISIERCTHLYAYFRCNRSPGWFLFFFCLTVWACRYLLSPFSSLRLLLSRKKKKKNIVDIEKRTIKRNGR